MKFLVDNQLPVALARYLSAQGYVASHVLDVDLDEADDAAIWRWAGKEGWTIISKDEDFFHFANQSKGAMQVVWVRLGNCRKQTLLATFGKLMPQIVNALEQGTRIVEIRQTD